MDNPYERLVDEWTLYAPPKSTSFGHTARKRDPFAAWSMTRAFLETHTLTTFRPDSVLVALEPGPFIGRAAARAAFAAAETRFGAPERLPGGLHQWPLSEERIETALSLGLQDEWAGETVGPLLIQAGYWFTWRKLLPPEPAQDLTAIEPPVPHCVSTLGVSLTKRRLFLSPLFFWPIPWFEEELESHLREIKPDCPIRLRDRYFSRVPISKSAKADRKLKLGKGWRGA